MLLSNILCAFLPSQTIITAFLSYIQHFFIIISFYFAKLQPQTSNNEFYANFYDTKNQNWSIRFNTVEDADNFAVNFALAKYYDNPTSNELIIQDIYVPTKGVVRFLHIGIISLR